MLKSFLFFLNNNHRIVKIATVYRNLVRPFIYLFFQQTIQHRNRLSRSLYEALVLSVLLVKFHYVVKSHVVSLLRKL